MITFKRRVVGFTLLEILISVAIFSVILIAISKMTTSSGHMLQLSANSFQAFQLGSKVMENLIEDGRINGDIISLFERFPEMTTKDSVRESQSVYFRFIKDRVAPWAEILPQEGGIKPEDGILFDNLKTFNAFALADRKCNPNIPGYERHLASAQILIDWEEKDGAKRSFLLPLLLPSPYGPSATESIILFSESELEALICAKLFPDLTNRTFDQAVMEKNCDRGLAFHVGKIAVFSDTLAASMTAIADDLKNLTQKRKQLMAAPDLDLVDTHLKICRLVEASASLVYFTLSELVESVKYIDQTGDSANLGAVPKAPFLESMKLFQDKPKEVIKWVKSARDSYQWLLSPGFKLIIPSREKESARLKTIEAYRLLAALAAIPIKEYKDFVEAQNDIYSVKNPFLHRLYLFEAKLAQNPALLKTAFPNLQSIVDAFDNQIYPCATMSQDLISRYPGSS